MMIKMLMDIPDDVFKHMLLPCFTVHDIVKLDCSCLNLEYRYQLINKIKGVELIQDIILKGDVELLFKWLRLRGIYIHSMNLILKIVDQSYFYSYYPKIQFKNNYMKKIRSNKDVDMIVCQSIEIDGCHSIRISDDTMLSITNHFTELQSLSIKNCIVLIMD